jgi:hypothetical protein
MVAASNIIHFIWQKVLSPVIESEIFKNAVGRGGLGDQLGFISVCGSTAERICDKVSSFVTSSGDI